MSGTSGYPTSKSKVEEIRYLEKCLKEVLATLAESFSEDPEDVVIFIGPTKSGKSTLLNALLGNNLIGEKINLRTISIRKADTEPGPTIGRGAAAETVYPTRWTDPEKLGTLIFWDCPGFEDNRSSIQDIINALCIHSLFNNVKSAKIVLTVDVNDILSDCVNSFLSLLTSLDNLFKEKLTNCFSSIIVVFTKVPFYLNDEPITVEFISGVLKEQILSSTSVAMPVSARNFIEYLSKNQYQIKLFRIAEVGPIPNHVVDDVVKSIQSLNSVHREILKTASPSIANESKLFLYNALEILTPRDSFIKLQNNIKSTLDSTLNTYRNAIKLQSRETLNNIKEEVEFFKCQLITETDTNFREKIEIMRNAEQIFFLSKNINANDLIEDLIEKSKIMEFVDGILGLKESSLFNLNVRFLMEKAKLDVNQLIIDLQLNMHEIDKKKAEDELVKIEQERKVKEESIREELDRLEKENRKARKGFLARADKWLDNIIETGRILCSFLPAPPAIVEGKSLSNFDYINENGEVD